MHAAKRVLDADGDLGGDGLAGRVRHLDRVGPAAVDLRRGVAAVSVALNGAPCRETVESSTARNATTCTSFERGTYGELYGRRRPP
jgi:hypothetical protein